MEIVNIKDEQRERLCSELAKLTYQFRKSDIVECIYYSSYSKLGNIKDNVIEFTVVINTQLDREIYKKIDEYNKLYREKDEMQDFGINIYIDVDYDREYTMDKSNSVARNKLHNSYILFDNTGKFKKIKEIADYGIYGKPFNYGNRISIEPPIKDRIDYYMDINGSTNTRVLKK